MSYIVFARKYRPQRFDEIIGQSPIIRTLKNAISQNRVSHAYIFAGPRGIGKTTTARILAKALNCEKGPAPEPCNSCVSCIEITKGSSLDVIEIDGASNRGIDEIRNLRENTKFAPSRARFKVYIIDEVHMLTAEAFNALLKTLEEPPLHVKFIFATTQAHKVPATILSRCQRFDFRRLSTKDIFDNLKNIVNKEGLEIKDEALGLIAKYSDGALRDGQVILDQMLSFKPGKVEPEDIVKVLGIIDEEALFGISNSIKEKDAVRALKIIDNLINEGKDVFQIVSSLIEHFRNISIIKISKDLDSLIDAGPERLVRYEDEAQKFTIEEILYIIYTLSNAIDFMRKAGFARVPLEAAMVKLAKAGSIIPLSEIVSRINGLEEKLRGAAGVKFEKPEDTGPTHRLPKRDAPKQERLDSQAAPQPLKTIEIDDILSSWTGIINYIKAKKMSVGSYLEEGYPVNLDAGTLSIGFPEEFKFNKEVLESPENKRLIEEALNSEFKLELKVQFTVVEPVRAEGDPVKRNNRGLEPADESAGKDKGPLNSEDVEPIIKSALDVFGGAILKDERRAASR